MKKWRLLLFLFLCLPRAASLWADAESLLISPQEPDYLNYEELISLSLNPAPEGELKEKLDRFFRTPLIHHEAYSPEDRRFLSRDFRLGPLIRVASWNIEKSLSVPQAIKLLTSQEAFEAMIDTEEVHRDSEEWIHMLRQRNRIARADIILLQEMDIGVKRSGYLNAAGEIAKALNMNYVFAPQYLEIDPVQLGIDQVFLDDGTEDIEATDYYQADPEKYKGVFGSAVLSRFPVKHAEVRPLKHQPYDWYHGEKKKPTFLESARRFGTKTVFKNEITREMKVGGRHYFRVDLEIPELEGGILTIINVHLEIKCLPKDRQEQLREILDEIKEIRNPVILMGDFNAAHEDISPTSLGRALKRTAKNPSTWLNIAVSAVTPYGLPINVTRTISNHTKNLNNPLAADIKIIAPNKLKSMFKMIENFRFSDGKAFDFRGDENRSINGRDGILANSNERGFKGFRTTFSVKRAIGVIGKYRLDWAFVKSYLYDPGDRNATYQFAPHFGETLYDMNENLIEKISDHHPNVIDLPLGDPNI